MKSCHITLILFFLCLFTQAASPQWIKQNVNTTASLRGLSVVNEKIVWASGTGGTVIRTIDGGEKWDVITVPGAEKLDFRDIEAFDDKTAYILSIGNGESSRIYKTADGGKKWLLEFQNDDPKAFFDAIACWDRDHCIAMSDPVGGHFLTISTTDGKAWQSPVSNKNLSANDGEAAFAASGTCLIAQGKHSAFLVSGGSVSRVFESYDRGLTWNDDYDSPFVHGASGTGIFSIAMVDDKNGVIVGGNYEKPEEHEKNLAFTTDGGTTWTLRTGLNGYRSSVAYVNKNIILAVGTNGSDLSYDGGKTWSGLDKENYNAVQSKGLSATWAVGPKGRVAVCPILQLQKTRESRRSN